MLYDILSPLLFFASLGGILLIVGRVVIRIRREQLSTNIRSVAAHTPSGLTTSWHSSGTEVTQLLKPTQKSVHALRSRFALLWQMLKQSRESVVSWRARRRAAKAMKAAASPTVPAAADVETVELRSGETPGVVQAPRQGRWRQLASWRARRRDRIEEIPAVPVASVTEMTDAPAPAVPVVTETIAVTQPAAQAATPSKPEPMAVPKPVAPAPVEDSRGFASTLIKRVQAQRVNRTKPNVLQSAEQELQQQHFQSAEDLLVTYIVKHPKDTAAYMLLGQVAMGKEAWAEAMEIFEQVIKWNRQQQGAYASLGLAAYHAGKFTRALQALQRAQDSQPDNREVLDCLMSIAEKMDNPALQHSIQEKIEKLEIADKQKSVRENAAA